MRRRIFLCGRALAIYNGEQEIGKTQNFDAVDLWSGVDQLAQGKPKLFPSPSTTAKYYLIPLKDGKASVYFMIGTLGPGDPETCDLLLYDILTAADLS